MLHNDIGIVAVLNTLNECNNMCHMLHAYVRVLHLLCCLSMQY